MKAFLSHSSANKEFVRAVAKELGRQFCVYDEQSFSTGEEFRHSIEKGLDESSIFVLFASKAALESLWVDFEIDEAWVRKLRDSLSKSLVYLIESSVDVVDLPEWLRRARVTREISPKVVARDIRHHIDELLLQRQYPYFVGRGDKINELEEAITPLDGSPPPHAFFVTGLPGIGRRSIIRRTAPNVLNLRKQVEIRIGEGDSINDICVNLADLIEPYSTKEGFERIVGQIKSLDTEAALERSVTDLRDLVTSGELPVFLDEGGLLDDEGYIREPIKSILKLMPANDTVYLFFVSHRRPQMSFGQKLPIVSLGPLQEPETKRLLAMLAGRNNLTISPGEISDLATYVAGYPPAAYFAIQQAREYGLELVSREKARLVQFRTAVFLRHLAKLTLQSYERDLLRILAIFSPLPLSVLGEALAVDLVQIQGTIIRLIDLALVVTSEQGYYRIADPVSDAALKAFGYPSDAHNRAVAVSLAKFLKESDIESSRLALSRVLFRAALLAREKGIAESAVHLANDLIRLTETRYHEREYGEVIELGTLALAERPDSVTARSFLIRALIQEERWEEAEDQLKQFQKYSPLREVYFLAGFLEKKRRDLGAAIDYYEKARQAGRRGAAISRELAHCYFLIGEHEEASRYIAEALERHGDDPYVVDLWAQIALQRGDEESTRKALSRLEVLDDPFYYKHRLSRVELTFGNLPEALIAAREAVEGAKSPHFEALANLIYCEIKSGNLTEAEKLLDKLDSQFGNLRRDIRVALRCSFEVARGNYSDALLQADRIVDKNTIFYKRIRYDSLVGEIRHSALNDDLREKYSLEADALLEEFRATGKPTHYIELDQF